MNTAATVVLPAVARVHTSLIRPRARSGTRGDGPITNGYFGDGSAATTPSAASSSTCLEAWPRHGRLQHMSRNWRRRRHLSGIGGSCLHLCLAEAAHSSL